MNGDPLEEPSKPPTDSFGKSPFVEPSAVEPSEVEPNPYVTPAGLPVSASSFGLSALLLTITLLSVCMAVTYYLPGMGVLMFLLSVPALLRTWWIRNRRLAQQKRMSIGDKVVAFLASLAVVGLLAASSIGAFAVVCFPLGYLGFGISYNGGADELGMVVFIGAWVLGIIAGAVVGFFFVRWFWRLGA